MVDLMGAYRHFIRLAFAYPFYRDEAFTLK